MREKAPPTPAEDVQMMLPVEMQYAADLDFLSKVASHLEKML